MPIAQKRTRYLEHQNLARNQLAQFRQGQQQPFHHLGHTKLESDDPTKVGERCTSRACYLPSQSSVALTLQVQSLLHRCEPHLLMLLQEVPLLQTTALISAVQLLCRNVNSDQLREYMDASRQQCDRVPLISPRLQYEQRSDPCHRIQCRCLP